jgi:sulfur carrier protein
MSVLMNGIKQECTAGETLEDFVARVLPSRETRGVAVIVNDELVPRARWREVRLADHSKIEILRAMAGG